LRAPGIGRGTRCRVGHADAACRHNQKGAKVKFIFADDGVVLLPQDMFILKKATHPNAAKLSIDLILSEEGQVVRARRWFRAATASSVRGCPRPGIESLKPLPIDRVSRLRSLKKIRHEWTGIFNR
jgi:ABC-type Fe3+ transport system substrate-binding protein